MVTEEGMGSKLRDRAYSDEEGGLMFDKMTRERNYSDKTAEEIDNEIDEILTEATSRAREVLKANRLILDKLAKELLKHETLDDEQVKILLKGAKLPTKAKLY
jgi:cell division protease FtsH